MDHVKLALLLPILVAAAACTVSKPIHADADEIEAAIREADEQAAAVGELDNAAACEAQNAHDVENAY